MGVESMPPEGSPDQPGETFVNIEAPDATVNVREELSGKEVDSLNGEIYLTSHYYEVPGGSSDGLLPGDDDAYESNLDFMNAFISRLSDHEPAFSASLGGETIQFDPAIMPPVATILGLPPARPVGKLKEKPRGAARPRRRRRSKD